MRLLILVIALMTFSWANGQQQKPLDENDDVTYQGKSVFKELDGLAPGQSGFFQSDVGLNPIDWNAKPTTPKPGPPPAPVQFFPPQSQSTQPRFNQQQHTQQTAQQFYSQQHVQTQQPQFQPTSFQNRIHQGQTSRPSFQENEQVPKRPTVSTPRPVTEQFVNYHHQAPSALHNQEPDVKVVNQYQHQQYFQRPAQNPSNTRYSAQPLQKTVLNQFPSRNSQNLEPTSSFHPAPLPAHRLPNNDEKDQNKERELIREQKPSQAFDSYYENKKPATDFSAGQSYDFQSRDNQNLPTVKIERVPVKVRVQGPVPSSQPVQPQPEIEQVQHQYNSNHEQSQEPLSHRKPLRPLQNNANSDFGTRQNHPRHEESTEHQTNEPGRTRLVHARLRAKVQDKDNQEPHLRPRIKLVGRHRVHPQQSPVLESELSASNVRRDEQLGNDNNQPEEFKEQVPSDVVSSQRRPVVAQNNDNLAPQQIQQQDYQGERSSQSFTPHHKTQNYPKGFRRPTEEGAAVEDESPEAIAHKQASNAKYAFQSSFNDTINDNSQTRQEVRDGLSLKGLYSYSDGFYKRTVYYVADEGGFRVVKEDSEPIGDGPLIDPEGKVDFNTNINGQELQYTVKANQLPGSRRNQAVNIDTRVDDSDDFRPQHQRQRHYERQ